MAIATGNQPARCNPRRIDELKTVCEELDANTGSGEPVGLWSPKEIISHLLGPDGSGFRPILQAFLERETSIIDIDPENPVPMLRDSRFEYPHAGDLNRLATGRG